MSEFADYFIKRYGSPELTVALRPDELDQAERVLPQQLIELYRRFGRCVMRGGRIQLCLPDDLGPVLDQTFDGDETFSSSNTHAFAYTAFGCIYFFHESLGLGSVDLLTGHVEVEDLTSPPPPGTPIDTAVHIPLVLSDESLDFRDLDGNPLFERATKALGTLQIGECYGFFPALGLCGIAHIDYVRRTPARAHMSLICQMTEFAIFGTTETYSLFLHRKVGPQ
ncbi:GAD-like domain-containing protein [Stenotrophomonas sp. TWI700]|uniref:GAD-like domain-containing protein n=1 Tax=Stenotrophomonas sp. TWI700 TaxID=3136792 RepID=UPI00320A857F